MATSNGSILNTIESTVSTSSVETEIDDDVGSVESEVKDDVKNKASEIAQDVPIPSVVPTGTITDALGTLEGMFDGNETTADGTVIPREAMVNTALIIFGDFAATFIAYAIVTNYAVFGKQFLHYDNDEMERTNLIVIGIDAGFYLLTGCLTDWYHGYIVAMRIYWMICFIGRFIHGGTSMVYWTTFSGVALIRSIWSTPLFSISPLATPFANYSHSNEHHENISAKRKDHWKKKKT